MTVGVLLELLLLLERGPAQVAGVRLVLGVGPPDVAVVGRVRREGLPAVLALEGPLSGVLADVRAQDTGGGEGLEERDLQDQGLVLICRLFLFLFFGFTMIMMAGKTGG